MHLVLVKALGNKLLIGVYGRLMDRISRIRNFYGDRFTKRRLHDIVSEHTGILDAIVCGDTVTAEQMMTEHFQNARAFLAGLTDFENGVKQWSM
jgi:DNA-binding GntR family transcriptional regulator